LNLRRIRGDIASHGAGSISHRNVLGRVSLPQD